MIITIEGNIGAGKSVFAESLCELLQCQGFKTIHFKEPVEEWINLNGENLLKLFYDDSQRWAFTFQVNALVNIRRMETAAIRYSQENYIVVMERSSFSVEQIFCEYLSKHVFHPVEDSIFETIKSSVPQSLEKYEHHWIIYLKTDPDTCMKRIFTRARTEEIGKIDLKYIQELHIIHENALCVRKNVLTIDGSSYDKTSFIEAKVFNQSNTFALDELNKILRTWQASNRNE